MNDSITLTPAPSLPIKHGSASPFSREFVVLTKQEHIDLNWQINYYKFQHQSALKREAELKKQLDQEKAKVRDLNQRLYGKKAEKSKKSKDQPKDTLPPSPRPRGQQADTNGHGRTDRPHLPVIEEILDLPEDEKLCTDCGLPHQALGSTDDAKIVEVQVKAYVRQIRRKKYVRCGCQGKKGIITVAPVPRLLNRSDMGVSVWVEILLDKYLYAQATHRRLIDFNSLGYPLSQGTVTGGLQRLDPLFAPLIKAMLDKHLSERLFHADETGWKVFEKLADKEGYRWYLWLMQSPSVAFYKMAPGRDAGIPIEHFSGLEEKKLTVFLVCDRYGAYKKLVKNIPIIVLAFCWTHVRRDFLDAARAWPHLEAWMFGWVENIGGLYYTNKLRLAHWNEDIPLDQQSNAFNQHQSVLLDQLSDMKKARDAMLQQEDLHSVQRSVLTSLETHWSGLVLFAKHPEIKMDNNLAERSLRNPVTGRKRYQGSGSIWSAELAALMFTAFQTILLWDINPRHWLTVYLTACAENGGKAPTDLSAYLPWEMTKEQRHTLSLPASMTQIDDIPLIQDSG